MSTEDTTVDRSDQDTDGPSGSRQGLGRWLLGLLVTTVLLALLVKTFLLQAFYIPSTSMEPGLEVGDRILVQKVSTWVGSPDRGDVVVFEDPGGWLGAQGEPEGNALTSTLGAVGLYPEGGHLVKRVVGVEGDVIECCDDGRLTINGSDPLEETAYVDVEGLTCLGPMTGNCDWTAGPVPEGEIFVMGDNRDASGDSTTHLCTEMETDCTDDPFVEEDLVVGTVLATVWPFDRFGLQGGSASSFDDVPDPVTAP
ncbi:signal peptidase I [Nocardioides sp. AX2bis]|uniref:signal peptidase I n=1 Tax=Nocardioides sp. AX2bis TaxID=2653157 RepID=UPI0012F05944|nr:signal peptidase I [Nocardioides sp. AX2bis]VXB77992.1 Signal peptidase I [Nocardioides sp. AX2bis]